MTGFITSTTGGLCIPSGGGAKEHPKELRLNVVPLLSA